MRDSFLLNISAKTKRIDIDHENQIITVYQGTEAGEIGNFRVNKREVKPPKNKKQ